MQTQMQDAASDLQLVAKLQGPLEQEELGVTVEHHDLQNSADIADTWFVMLPKSEYRLRDKYGYIVQG